MAVNYQMTPQEAAGGAQGISDYNARIARERATGTSVSPVTSSGEQLTQEMIDALHFLGWTDQQIQSASITDAKNWALTGEYLKKQTDLQGMQGQMDAQKLNDAYKAALKDPNIVAKYGDMQKLDTQSFQQNLDYLQQQSSLDAQNLARQFAQERQNLAEANAAAGTAYSGFRGEAQSNLAKQQSGIITSTRSQLKKNVNDLTSQFEAKYGSAATTPASVQFTDPYMAGGVGLSGLTQMGPAPTTTISGQEAGGITGTVAPAREADVLAKQQDIYGTLSSPIYTRPVPTTSTNPVPTATAPTPTKTIDPTQYQMTRSEATGGQAGIDAYNARIAQLYK